MTVTTSVRSDNELLQAISEGDKNAFSTLWERHFNAAVRAAGQYRGLADPEDIAQESFTQVYIAASDGRGPTGPFRPYLYRIVRNLAVSSARRRRPVAVGDDEDLEARGHDILRDPTEGTIERSFIVKAFRNLPQPWQDVLWYTAVEDMPPREVAILLGLTPNATATLAVRAREGLRQEWLAAHLNETTAEDPCRVCVRDLPAYVRGRLSRRRRDAVDRHLADCARCTAREAEIGDLSVSLRRALVPLVLGIPAPDLFAAVHPSRFSSHLIPKPGPPHGPFPRPAPLVLVGAAVALIMVVGAVVLVTSGTEPPAAGSEPVGEVARSGLPAPLAGPEAPDAAPSPEATDAPTAPPDPTASPDPGAGGVATGDAPGPGSAGAPRPGDDSEAPGDPRAEGDRVAAPTMTGPAPGWVVTLPTLTGIATPGAVVTVLTDGRRTATVTAGPSGAWSYTPPTPGVGTFAFTVVQQHSGVESAPSATAGPYTVSAPTLSGASGGSVHVTRSTAGNVAGSTQVLLTVQAHPGGTIAFALDDVETQVPKRVGTSGTVGYIWQDVPVGSHTARLQYVDPATGARGPAQTVTVVVS